MSLPTPVPSVLPTPTPPTTSAPDPETSAQTLERLLGKPPGVAAPAAPDQQFPPSGASIQRIVRASASNVTAPTAHNAAPASAADLELATRQRAILHHPDLQALEAAWRGLDFLVRRCPDEERIKRFMLAATLDELGADPAGFERALGDESWGAIIGCFTFGASAADLSLLEVLAGICEGLDTTFIAGAHPQLVACDSFAAHSDPDEWRSPPPANVREAWERLRVHRAAARVGLALPRFLLRQPYGRAGEAIEGFAFEELGSGEPHESFYPITTWLVAGPACARPGSG